MGPDARHPQSHRRLLRRDLLPRALAWIIHSVRFFSARDEKLEAAGKVVPGFADLLMVAAALRSPSGWAILCVALALPLMIVGRAEKEHLTRSLKPPAPGQPNTVSRRRADR